MAERFRTWSLEAARFAFGVAALVFGSLVLGGCTAHLAHDSRIEPGQERVEVCLNPDCECGCKPSGPSSEPSVSSRPCKCSLETCDCPCPHLVCDGRSCRLVDPVREGAAAPPAVLDFEATYEAAGPAASDDIGAPSGIDCPHELLAGDVPADVREWFHNRTMPGSCVQCSIGMCGVAQSVPNASLLLWPSDYGPAELHGASPSRVAAYARKRGLAIWNVTGAQNTYDFMRWACRNGRPCAISCNQAHFQTLFGHDPGPTDAANDDRWFVVDNNYPDQVSAYGDAEFRRRHEAMGTDGAWTVILDSPPGAPRPEYVAWWR